MEPAKARTSGGGVNLPELCQITSEASPIPLAALTVAGNVIRYVNPAFCALAGQIKEKLLGRSFEEAVPAATECLASLDRVCKTGKAETHVGGEHTLQVPYWSYVIWPAVAPDGTVLGTFIQVTESMKAHDHAVAMNQELLIRSLRQHELIHRTEAFNQELQLEILDRKLA